MRNRKYVIAIVLGLSMLCITACGQQGASSHNNSASQSIAQVLETEMAKEDEKAEKSEEAEKSGETENEEVQQAEDDGKDGADNSVGTDNSAGTDYSIDIDLTVLSSDLVYAEVYNMMARPDDYVGKVVKMTGAYSYYHDDATGSDYHACIIQDATACCAQGIEFVPTAEYSFPEDYPADGEDVTVVGIFDVYLEADFAFLTLREADIL